MRELCIITGGAGGIGLAAAKIVGRDHSVVICDVNPTRVDAAATELWDLGVECKPVVATSPTRTLSPSLSANQRHSVRLPRSSTQQG